MTERTALQNWANLRILRGWSGVARDAPVRTELARVEDDDPLVWQVQVWLDAPPATVVYLEINLGNGRANWTWTRSWTTGGDAGMQLASSDEVAARFLAVSAWYAGPDGQPVRAVASVAPRGVRGT